MKYGIPVFGTMAHTYVRAHDSEAESFEAFAALYPETTLLVDTLTRSRASASDRPDAERSAISFVRGRYGSIPAICAAWPRRRASYWMKRAGLKLVTIFASSSLDEYQIQDLVKAGAPIDAFGVGIKLAVMEDASHLEYGSKGRLKLSAKKVLYPGRKQVFRQVEAGHMIHDVIGRFDAELPVERLLQPMIRHGHATSNVDLEESRKRFQSELMRLTQPVRDPGPSPVPYSVSCSERLQDDLDKARKKLLLALEASML